MRYTHKTTTMRSALRAAALMAVCFSVCWAAQNPRSERAIGRDTFINHCAVCHRENSGTRAPLPRILRQMSSQEILEALETGVMKAQGSGLTAQERKAVARFLGRRQRVLRRITTGFCGVSSLRAGDAAWNGWGNSSTNARFQPASAADLDLNQVRKLKLKWVFGFPGASTVQPTVSEGRVLVAASDGSVYSLGAETGCIDWIFKAASGVRAAISVSADGQEAYVADSGANVYAVTMASGTLIWKTHIDPHPLARITGAPLLLKGRLYVPVTSGEEGAAVNPYYPCCTFRGGVVALDARSGKQIWKAYAIPTKPKVTGKNAVGVPTWGPSGAAVWSAPTADLRRRAIYVGTGNNYSDPAGKHSDAIVAFDMDTGKMLWSRQVTPDDRWTIACLRSNKTNCPPNPGDDYDFGTSPILTQLPGGRSLVLAAQKSGMVYALDPDQAGKVIWKARVAKGGPEGGVEWGGAAGLGNAYFPVSDWKQSAPDAGGGLVALRIATGAQIWHAPPVSPGCEKKPGCSAAQVAPVTLIPGVVFSGSLDGHLRAYDARNGQIIWDFNTAQELKTTDGIEAHGGSLNKDGPVVADGMLYVESGNFVGMPGNALLAFSIDGK
ncbi:MAG TPA: PQQ-binding-like beta-propeller repeat protein [Terriglobia bacterium]|nr:PQQ-binding-like beta-propeller repeat protein [Terriglobia bacterium]